MNTFFRQYLPKWLVLVFLVALAARFPYFVEKFYSRGIYVIIRNIDLFFLRWLPFSAGDLLYLLFPFWMIYRLARLPKNNKAPFVEKIIWNAVWIFYLSWGLNYYRLPVASRQSLELNGSSQTEIAFVTESLIDSLNRLHLALQPDTNKIIPLPTTADMKRNAALLYRNQAERYPYLYQPYYVIKPSLISRAVSYLGVTGYFNPYTHEAQYNRLYPVAFRPHILLHELAHQTGYAYENEAEYLAWQTAVENNDKIFRYSAHLNALEYFLQYWHHADTSRWKEYKNRLFPGIRQSFDEARRFQEKYRLKVDLSRPYHYFLKINQKGKGTESYSELMLYITAYYRKHHYIR